MSMSISDRFNILIPLSCEDVLRHACRIMVVMIPLLFEIKANLRELRLSSLIRVNFLIFTRIVQWHLRKTNLITIFYI